VQMYGHSKGVRLHYGPTVAKRHIFHPQLDFRLLPIPAGPMLIVEFPTPGRTTELAGM
jgi:hypothetical protein